MNEKEQELADYIMKQIREYSNVDEMLGYVTSYKILMEAVEIRQNINFKQTQ